MSRGVGSLFRSQLPKLLRHNPAVYRCPWGLASRSTEQIKNSGPLRISRAARKMGENIYISVEKLLLNPHNSLFVNYNAFFAQRVDLIQKGGFSLPPESRLDYSTSSFSSASAALPALLPCPACPGHPPHDLTSSTRTSAPSSYHNRSQINSHTKPAPTSLSLSTRSHFYSHCFTPSVETNSRFISLLK